MKRRRLPPAVELVIWVGFGFFLAAYAYLLAGCAAQVGPVAWAVGQASVCRGPSETTYGPEGVTSERCEGGYVAGGALSSSAGRVVSVIGDGLRMVAPP